MSDQSKTLQTDPSSGKEYDEKQHATIQEQEAEITKLNKIIADYKAREDERGEERERIAKIE